MASVSWTSTTSGTWSTGGNWNVATGPQAGDDVTVNGGSGSLTVTYNTGSLLLDSLSMSAASLNMVAGTLATAGYYALGGGLTETGGVLRLGATSSGSGISGTVSLTGGSLAFIGGAYLNNGTLSQAKASAIQITRGALSISDSFTTLGGTISGAGALILASNNATLSAGFALATASATVASGTVFLQENLAYANAFTLSQNGTLNLGASTLTLTGLASLNGTIANSAVKLLGTGHFNGLTLENGTQALVSGTYTQLGQIVLGATGTGTLDISSTGTLRLAGNNDITNASQGGLLINAGTITKTGGGALGGNERIFAGIENTGTINIAAGNIDLYGPSNGFTSTLDGTISGAGGLVLETGNYLINSNTFALETARTTLAQSASLTLTNTGLVYAGAYDQTGGTLVVGSPGQTGESLTLSGEVALDGGLLKGTGTILSSGAVNLDNLASLEGNLTFDFGTSFTSNGTSTTGTGTATVSQTGTILLGNEADAITQAYIGTGESWLLKGTASILGYNGTITNLGLFQKLSGGGDSIVQNSVVNTGSLVVNSGILTLAGGGTLSGSVSGSAALDITGNLSLGTGLSLTVGELVLDDGRLTLAGGNLTYANGFAEEGGTLALGGNTLTLNGPTSFESGSIQGAGTGAAGVVVVNGTATIGQGPITDTPISLLQGAQLTFNGATEQNGTLTLSGGSVAPTLTIGAKGVYTLDAGASIGVPNSSVVGTVVVGGTLAASSGGTSTVTAAIVDDGTIRITNGELSFLGPLTGTGSLAISSGGTLILNDGTPEHNAIAFGTGGGVLSLAHPADFASVISGFSSGDVIELQGFAFGNITPTISGNTVTLTESGGQSTTLTFATAQTGTLLSVGEGPLGSLALIHN